jgi:hypothetical protein
MNFYFGDRLHNLEINMREISRGNSGTGNEIPRKDGAEGFVACPPNCGVGR